MGTLSDLPTGTDDEPDAEPVGEAGSHPGPVVIAFGAALLVALLASSSGLAEQSFIITAPGYVFGQSGRREPHR